MSTRALRVVGVIIAIIALGGALLLSVGHRRALQRERDRRAATPKMRLVVMPVEAGRPERDVSLPADAKPLLMATLYAKTSGYMREIAVDKGTAVKSGQVIARIASPETDAEVINAQTEVNLRTRLARRAETLHAQGLASQQDLELAEAELGTARISLTKALALQSYETLRAPFDGVVIARYADPGALIPAATAATASGLPVVDVAVLDTLKVTLFLGQDLAGAVHPGDPVEIRADDKPDAPVTTKITRVAGALDPRTRTEQIEIELDNRDRKVVANSFVHVKMKIAASPHPRVPTEALLVRNGKTQVALAPDGHLQFVDVTVGHNDGKTVEITSGVRAGDRVAIDVPSELEEGTAIDPVAPPAPSGSAVGGGPH